MWGRVGASSLLQTHHIRGIIGKFCGGLGSIYRIVLNLSIQQKMGGKAFTNGPDPLRTPRMPPAVYFALRDKYLSLLSTLYTHVATPIEAPDKTSYGDIDILVSHPQSPCPDNTGADFLRRFLAAGRTFTTSGSATISFAVPYPDISDNYVQIDLHTCRPSTFHWQLFQQSHGDLWNLLGTTIRPFGLTANDIGLHLRIAEIEELNRKRSLVFLTNDPNDVLNILGLNTETYWRPFESVEAMYEYVVGCRFFRREAYVRGDLKANDRKRLAHRELYRRFVDVWLAKNKSWIERQIDMQSTLQRDDVAEMVLNRFGKEGDFEAAAQGWRSEREELSRKQEGRQKRKEDALALEEYADAWIKWVNHNVGKRNSAFRNIVA